MAKADHEFFHGKSIAELVREQGVGPVKDISVFAGVIAEDEDVDVLIELLYKMREPPMRRCRSAGATLKRRKISPLRAARGDAEKRRELAKRRP